jgi:hypothetical protein
MMTPLATPTPNLIYPNLTVQDDVCTHFVNEKLLAGRNHVLKHVISGLSGERPFQLNYTR